MIKSLEVIQEDLKSLFLFYGIYVNIKELNIDADTNTHEDGLILGNVVIEDRKFDFGYAAIDIDDELYYFIHPFCATVFYMLEFVAGEMPPVEYYDRTAFNELLDSYFIKKGIPYNVR